MAPARGTDKVVAKSYRRSSLYRARYRAGESRACHGWRALYPIVDDDTAVLSVAFLVYVVVCSVLPLASTEGGRKESAGVRLLPEVRKPHQVFMRSASVEA